jgi:hypothetical protein
MAYRRHTVAAAAPTAGITKAPAATTKAHIHQTPAGFHNFKNSNFDTCSPLPALQISQLFLNITT